MNSAASAVQLEEVVFRWPRARQPSLAIEQLTIKRGERLFVRGPSGSGKSTLLGIIGGVNQPQQGRVEVLGQDLRDLGTAARDRFRADHIGFIFQLFNLIPYLTVRENVLLPLRFSRRRAGLLGGRGQAEALRLLAHLGLETMSERIATDLSVGQQQRVACARALLGAPELIIADEPTSALDADARGAFIDLLLAECAAAGSTLLFVSHDGGLANHFDRQIDLCQLNGCPT